MSTNIFKSGYVSIIGAPNVGKSTLLNALIKEKISITSSKPQTTRNRIAGVYHSNRGQIIFLDTPGIHKSRDFFNDILVSAAITSVEDSDLVCFVVEPLEKIGKIDQFILSHIIAELAKPIILVINKVDTLKNKELLLPVIDYYKQFNFSAILPISALYNDGVSLVVENILGLLPEGPPYFPEDYITDKPERFIVAELIREQIYRLTNEEIPYCVFVSVETFQKKTGCVVIDAVVYVEKDSQKGIIIGKGGRMLKEIGIRAREGIEKFLGTSVLLNLFVKVLEKWRRNPGVLKEWGFWKTS